MHLNDEAGSAWLQIVFLLLIAVLVFCLHLPDRILTLAFIFFPFLDNANPVKGAAIPLRERHTYLLFSLLLCFVSYAMLLRQEAAAFSTLLIFAKLFLIISVPEEWYFRVYLLTRLGGGLKANVLSSLLFTCLHVLASGRLDSTAVFPFSLMFGYLYIRTGSLVLVATVHTLMNVIYLLIHDQISFFIH